MKLFIVGLLTKTCWEFCGVYDNMQDALKRCTQDNNFIALAFLNKDTPKESVEWQKLFYPKYHKTPEWFN